jgi:hypothetical protein
MTSLQLLVGLFDHLPIVKLLPEIEAVELR